MEIFWHEEASRELQAEFAWLEAQSSGLGVRLVESIRSAVSGIREFPRQGSPRPDGSRRFLLADFPFDLVYVELHDRIVVLALAHQRRRPGYWRRRRLDIR
jgi:plasmid stabilization system protein ParE